MCINYLRLISFKNRRALEIIVRIFKKQLLLQLNGNLDSYYKEGWSKDEWLRFFSETIKKDFKSVMLTWNKDTRKQLDMDLQEEIERFKEAQVKHQKSLNGSEKTLSHPALMFNQEKQVVSEVSNLKWNFE